MKDSALRQDIIDELEFEPYIDASDIGVAVQDGIVTLTGHVPNYSQRQAVERPSRIKGVRAIAQEIQIRYPGTPGTSDDEIAKRVVNTPKWSALLPDDRLHVKVQDGWVTLTGSLEWNYQKEGAGDAAGSQACIFGREEAHRRSSEAVCQSRGRQDPGGGLGQHGDPKGNSSCLW